MKIQSMTGYGESEQRGVRIEAKSLNHRFLDIQFKMPSSLNPYEIEFRNIVKEFFLRGRIEISISFTELSKIKMNVNKIMVNSLIESLREIQKENNIKEPLSINHLFWFKDVIFKQELEINPEDIKVTLRDALKNLKNMRIKEGIILAEEIQKIINSIDEMVIKIEDIMVDFIKEKFEEKKRKIKELLKDIEIEETRLFQEIALIAEKTDISEELSRLKSHIKQMKNIFKEGGSIGRKLDFLLQEIFREINTIGSKCTEYRISEIVIKIKSAIEKIRQQVQNLQ